MYRTLVIALISVFSVKSSAPGRGGSSSSSSEDCALTGYCVNFEGCSNTTINADTAECYGYLACKSATITSSDVYAYGYKALWDATVSNASEIKTPGYMGAHEASSLTTELLTAYGVHGASKTEIYAYDNVLEANFYGYRSGYYSDVYCEDGDDCEVRCGESQGCEGLDLICYSGSTCAYDCSDDTDYCPTLLCYSGATCTECDGDTDTDSDCSQFDSDLTDEEIDAIVIARKAYRLATKHDGVYLDEFPDSAVAKTAQLEADVELDDQDLVENMVVGDKDAPLDNEEVIHADDGNMELVHDGITIGRHHHHHHAWTKSPVFFWGLFALVVVLTNFVTYMCFFRSRNGYQKIVDMDAKV